MDGFNASWRFSGTSYGTPASLGTKVSISRPKLRVGSKKELPGHTTQGRQGSMIRPPTQYTTRTLPTPPNSNKPRIQSTYPSPTLEIPLTTAPVTRYATLPSPEFHRTRNPVLSQILPTTTNNQNRAIVELPLYLPVHDRNLSSRFSASTSGSPKKEIKKLEPTEEKFKLKSFLLSKTTPVTKEKSSQSKLRKFFGNKKNEEEPSEFADSILKSPMQDRSTASITTKASSTAGSMFKTFGKKVAGGLRRKASRLWDEAVISDDASFTSSLIGDESELVRSNTLLAVAEKISLRSRNSSFTGLTPPKAGRSNNNRASRIPIASIFPSLFPRNSSESELLFPSSVHESSAIPTPVKAQLVKRKPVPNSAFLRPPSPRSHRRSFHSDTSDNSSLDEHCLLNKIGGNSLNLPSPTRELNRNGRSNSGRRRAQDVVPDYNRSLSKATTDLAHLLFDVSARSQSGTQTQSSMKSNSYSDSDNHSLIRSISTDSFISNRSDQFNINDYDDDVPADLLELLQLNHTAELSTVSLDDMYLALPLPKVEDRSSTSSFEGRFTTAADNMLDLITPEFDVGIDSDDASSIIVYERPEVGEKMLNIDVEVSLTSLVASYASPIHSINSSPQASPPSNRLNQIQSSDFTSSTGFSFTSAPSPSKQVEGQSQFSRESLSRYSQTRIKQKTNPVMRISDMFYSSTDSSEGEMISTEEDDTVFSLNSTSSGCSPCPLPIVRKIAMIGSARTKKSSGRQLFNFPKALNTSWSGDRLDFGLEGTGRPTTFGLTIPLDTPPTSASSSSSSFSSGSSSRVRTSFESIRVRTLSIEGVDYNPSNVIDEVIFEEDSFIDNLNILQRSLSPPIKSSRINRSSNSSHVTVESLKTHLSSSNGFFVQDGGEILGFEVEQTVPWISDETKYEAFIRLGREVAQEIHASQMEFTRSDFSDEFVQDFNPPRGSVEILDFIADSQRLYRSTQFHAPIAPYQSPPRYTERIESKDPPTPISLFLQELAIEQVSPPSPPRIALTSKTTNRLLKSTTTVEPELLDDTLEKINSKFNHPRSFKQPGSPQKKRRVDVDFLGGQEVVELKRMLDFESTRMKLEGMKDKVESTELIGSGSGDNSFSFVKTPKPSSSRQNKIRKAGVASMR